ncbi:hypothetical protein PHYBOEH_005469 [Phytophthora boehmeriae]|uniref:Uncharacterized protein n=1 Tax=Phytophthora boehmeriae TaxID=109152 RepID=A0A8T1WNZ8_9STRA|nr:hypothetical protein PHYBOEH_005469 [Phytophthora boehmeriae]
MECAAGGFRALQSHVKAVKGNLPQCEGDTDETERSGVDGKNNLDASENAQQGNQDPLWEQQRQLRVLRSKAAFSKDQQMLKARERSIRSIENTLNEEMARVAEKSQNLDARILEITRLEARLHEALLLQEQKTAREPQEAEPSPAISDIAEREAVLDLRIKEVMLAKVQIDAKEKHIQAKERILSEKEVELATFEKGLERKDRERQQADMRFKLLEEKLLATHAEQMTVVENVKAELETRQSQLDERETQLAYREHATKAKVVALNQLQQIISQEHERSLLAQEDYLARGLYLQEETIVLKEQKEKCHRQEQLLKPPSAEAQNSEVSVVKIPLYMAA